MRAAARPALLTAALAYRVEFAYTAYTAATLEVIDSSPEKRGEVQRFGHTWAFRRPAQPFGWMYNRAAHFSEADLEHLPGLLAYFADAQVPARFEIIHPELSPQLSRALIDAGLFPSTCDAAYAGDIGSDHPLDTESAEIRVMPVTTQAEVATLLDVRQAAFHARPVLPEQLDSHCRRLLRPDQRHLLAWVDNQVAGFASLFVHHRTAYLALAGTAEAWRGRGVQQTLLQARLQLAREQGCDLAVAMTEPGGSSGRNLQRAGLGLVNTRTVWTRPLMPR